MGNDVFRLRELESRAATHENMHAERGAGGQVLGGRKGAPCIWPFRAGETHTLLDVEGSGMIRHIWCTIPPGHPLNLRNLILRMYWDGQDTPSVEVPLGDFFGTAHGRQRPFVSAMLSVADGKGFNCWIPMPFARHARITIENDSGGDVPMFFYQIDFTQGDAWDEETGFFHAQFRRQNPCPLQEDYTMLDGIEGKGVYLGTVLGVRSCAPCWWGEGEVKFYIDDDDAFPTICGTGAEDYVGLAWGLGEIATPWQGAPLVNPELGIYSIYRFHHRDPIYFQRRLRATIQQIGIGDRKLVKEHFGDRFIEYTPAGEQTNPDYRYFERSDDWCSVAYWYQTLPTKSFPPLPTRRERSADLLIEQESEKGPERADL